jgi:hypothetical protein
VLKKLLICQWFAAPFPPWIEYWMKSINSLEQYGYSWLLETDEDAFAERVKRVLGATYPRGDGRKVCDYRCAFGLLYEDEAGDYDYWGHTDLDVVYGRVGHLLPDELLGEYDIFSNHDTYVSGPWSLYRNDTIVNELFTEIEDWQGYFENPATTGWVETAFSRYVDRQHAEHRIVRRYESWQTQNLNNFNTVHWEGDRLMEGSDEVMMAHFRRTKVYPSRLR